MHRKMAKYSTIWAILVKLWDSNVRKTNCSILSPSELKRSTKDCSGEIWLFCRLDRPSQHLVQNWWMAIQYDMFPATGGGNYLVILSCSNVNDGTSSSAPSWTAVEWMRSRISTKFNSNSNCYPVHCCTTVEFLTNMKSSTNSDFSWQT